MAVSGCDNVGWGGVEVELRAPPPPPDAAPDQAREPGEETLAPLPRGPILYLARRGEDGAELLPVARLGSDGLRPLPEAMADEAFARRFTRERLAPGTRVVLFSQGSRVGTLEVSSGEARVDSSFCGPRPRMEGAVELVPSAASARAFLALSAPEGERFSRRSFSAHQSTYEQRVASLNLAASLIPQVGAIWPPSLLESRRDIRVFELQGSREPAIAATFVYRDGLQIGPAPEPSYSLFFVASHDGSAYRPAYVWYRDYDQDGKGAPRYVTHFDFDGDGADEILLEVLGETHRWLAVAGIRNGRWETLYQDPCGRPGSGGSPDRE